MYDIMGVVVYLMSDNRIVAPVRVILYGVYYFSDEVVGKVEGA